MRCSVALGRTRLQCILMLKYDSTNEYADECTGLLSMCSETAVHWVFRPSWAVSLLPEGWLEWLHHLIALLLVRLISRCTGIGMYCGTRCLTRFLYLTSGYVDEMLLNPANAMLVSFDDENVACEFSGIGGRSAPEWRVWLLLQTIASLLVSCQLKDLRLLFYKAPDQASQRIK